MPDQRKPAVLVVDDDPGMRRLISTVLEGAGFEVHEAEDGLAALAILGGLLPDAIISDLSMPRMSGYELVPVIRRRFPHIPVVVLSGSVGPDVVLPEIGANLYLRKGEIRPTELCKRIAELVQARLPSQTAVQATLAAAARPDEQ
jgi:CheY-like chemotaxis protein